MAEAADQTENEAAAGEGQAADESMLDEGAKDESMLAGEEGTEQQQEAGSDESKDDTPESYEYTVPDGYEVSEELNTGFQEFAKGQKFSAEQVQALVNYHAELNNGGKQAFAELRTQYTNEIKADPEIGGANLTQTKQMAAKALQQFGDDGLRNALIETGWDNYPGMLRMLSKVGRAVSESAFHSGQKDVREKTMAENFYPDQ